MCGMKKIEEEILAIGKTYIPAPLPEDIPRGKVGDCFDHCILVALTGRYRYVEGIARAPDNKGQWILHSWLTDGVNAYDPTWHMEDGEGRIYPVNTEYVGVEMDAKDVVRFMIVTGYRSVFANAWRNPELADKAKGKIT